MITIFEGPDGAGKTTLAKAYAELTGAPIVHVGPPSRNPLMDWLMLTDKYSGAVIFDRLHIGEQVYGPIYRHRDNLGSYGRKIFEHKRLMPRKAVLVMCVPPFAVSHANWARRKAEGGEMFPDEPGYKRVYGAFLRAQTELPSVWYDYTVEGEPGATLRRIDEVRTAFYTPAEKL